MSLDQVASRVSDFKGKPVITLSDGPFDKYPFTFGTNKAKRIVKCFAAIKAFADSVPDPVAKPQPAQAEIVRVPLK